MINSGPQRAISCLLAVTTDLAEERTRLIQSSVGCRPPMTSTTISASDKRMSSIFSVHCTEEGSQSTFLRATFRLRICVKNLCDGTSNRTEAEQGHLAAAALSGGRCRRILC